MLLTLQITSGLLSLIQCKKIGEILLILHLGAVDKRLKKSLVIDLVTAVLIAIILLVVFLGIFIHKGGVI